jgi:hypothetical protein
MIQIYYFISLKLQILNKNFTSYPNEGAAFFQGNGIVVTHAHGNFLEGFNGGKML